MNRPILDGALSRRALLKRAAYVAGAAAGAAAGSAALLSSPPSRAAEPTRLDPKDPAAAARGYVENATEVDAKKYPSYVKGSSCEDCLLLQGAAGPSYRPCSLFPGKTVAVGGWCSGWTAEI